MGSLITKTGELGTITFGIDRNARVADAATASHWLINGQRSRSFHQIVSRIETHHVPETEKGEDMVLWKHGEDDYRQQFSAAKTWNQLRQRKPVTEWNKAVWFPQGTPRFSFITWLTVLNRLSTGDRMRAWGLVQGCVFCGERDETRDHLFYACPYTYTIWLEIAKGLMGDKINPDWTDTLNFIVQRKSSTMDILLLKLALQTSIYYIWRERNSRRHSKGTIPAAQLTRMIDKSVRNKVVALNYKYPHKLEGLLRRWFEAGQS